MTSNEIAGNLQKMNVKQLSALNFAEKGHNIFLTGYAGTGKTYTLCKIVDILLINQKKVAVTASTGKAASVLKEKLGDTSISVTTIHRFSGILDGRYGNEELSRLLIENDRFERQRGNILNTDTIIIDEISMISCKIFSQLDFIFRSVRQSEKTFGGIQVIVAGDLRQLPPVPNPDYGDDGAFFITSTLMNNFHVLELDKIQRQEEEDLIRTINEVAW